MAKLDVYQVPADATIEKEVALLDDRNLLTGHSKTETVPHPRAGLWSARIDDQETMFFSTTSDGVWRRLRMLMNGIPPGTVRLRALRAGGKPMLTPAEGENDPEDYMSLPTAEARIYGFMNRGKLKEYNEAVSKEERSELSYREWRRQQAAEAAAEVAAAVPTESQ